METPHRVVDDIAGGIAGGAQGLIGAVTGAAKGAGKSLMGALDKPFAQVAGKMKGPHRIADALADTAAAAGTNFYANGVIGTAKILGEGLMKALDQPLEQIGSPPELGKFRGFKR